jgi:hypothetical protein
MCPRDEPEDPTHCLIGPRPNAIGDEVQMVFSMSRPDWLAASRHGAERGGRNAGQALEQRRFPRAVRADETENLSVVNREPCSP